MTSTLDQPRPAVGTRPPAAPATVTRLPTRPVQRTRREIDWTSVGLVAALLLLTGIVHAWGMSRSPGFTDDEGTYVAQAWAVLERGALSHYTYWYDHPPLGWVQLAGWLGLTGGLGRAPTAIAAARQVVLVAHLVSAALLFVLARRLRLSRAASAGAVLLFALSPLAVSMQRMVLLDNLALPWLLGALVLAASPKQRLGAVAASGACLAVAVLTKETFLLLVPVVVWLAWTRSDPRTRRFCLAAFAATFTLLVAMYPLFALLKGELVPGPDRVSLVDAISFQLFTRPSSGSVFDPSSSAHATVTAWLDLDTWLLLAGLVALPVACCIRRLRPIAAGMVLLAVMLVRGGYLPGPFVIVVLPLAALVVAGVADALWRAPGVVAGLHVGRVAVLAALVVAGAVVAPQWASADRQLATADHVTPVVRGERWLEQNAGRRSTLIIDDSLWVDLVERGFDPDRVVWFQKLDFTQNNDPSITHRFPRGWRQFDYLVSTPVLRGSLEAFPDGMTDVRAALRHSRPVVVFGDAGDRVEIRRIAPPGGGGRP